MGACVPEKVSGGSRQVMKFKHQTEGLRIEVFKFRHENCIYTSAV
jgi:hypothetical protein